MTTSTGNYSTREPVGRRWPLAERGLSCLPLVAAFRFPAVFGPAAVRKNGAPAPRRIAIGLGSGDVLFPGGPACRILLRSRPQPVRAGLGGPGHPLCCLRSSPFDVAVRAAGLVERSTDRQCLFLARRCSHRWCRPAVLRYLGERTSSAGVVLALRPPPCSLTRISSTAPPTSALSFRCSPTRS